MRIIYIRTIDFPIGGASANRLLGICKALSYNNVDVNVCQISPPKLGYAENKLKNQVYSGIKINNLVYKFNCKNRLLFKLVSIYGIFKSLAFIISQNRTKHIDYVGINTPKISILIFYYVICKMLNIKLIRDLNEYPNYILQNKKPSLFENLSYKLYDKIYCISNNLIDFYKPLTSKKCECFLLPMTVDEDRFKHQAEDDILNQEYISYCGDLSQSKDGVKDLIYAFSLITDKYPCVKLKLIGANRDKNYMDSIYKLIEELKLKDKIVLTGLVKSDEIPSHLYKSRLLLLCRPNNVQAQGGFPTKLGEYLLTGIPVVLTNVGEISSYLKDGVSAYITEPDNIQSFAMKIEAALTDKNSIKIGSEGRKVALDNFSYKSQSIILSQYLK